MRWLLSVLLVGLSTGCLVAQSGFVRTVEPTHDGRRITVDLPASQHHRNVGGSDGAGLCVYSSVWHSAIWASVKDIYEFRSWMQKRPGGSYPEKFVSTLTAYCKEKGVPVPPYIQHTGGDLEVLELALKTGRSVGVTYCGVDPNYGTEVIAHMVNLVHLDDKWACILDNNFIGSFLWMPRDEFIARWRGVKTNGSPYLVRVGSRWMEVGGGWCIVLLDSPPPPYSHAKPQFQTNQCRNGVCSEAKWVPHTNGREWYLVEGGKFKAVCFAGGRCEGVDVYGNANGIEIAPPLPVPGAAQTESTVPVGDFPRGGVDPSKVQPDQQFWHTGQRCTKQKVVESLIGAGLTDDSARWHLTVVGDAVFQAKVRGAFDKLDPTLRNKIHFKSYFPSDWQVGQFDLDVGVTLRAPAVGRIGRNLNFISAEEWGEGSVIKLMTTTDGPIPPTVKPDPVIKPAPSPTPSPTPQPTPVTLSDALWAVIVAVLGWLAIRRKR